MHTLPPLLALTLAGVASAQTWEFTFTNEVLTPENPSTTMTLWASFAPSDWAFGAGDPELRSSEPGWDAASFMTLIPHPGQRPGELQPDGRTIAGIIVGQIYSLHFAPEPTNPIATWQATFEVSDFSEREITFSTRTERFHVFPDERTIVAVPRTPIDVEVAIRVIPAPAPLALLALGASAATRRRRPH